MANKLFKSLFAMVMVLGSALGFVACEDQGEDVVANPTVDVSTTSMNFTMEEGSQTVKITANADWMTEVKDADWVTVTPSAGVGDATMTVAVAMNDTGAVREATINVIAMHKTYGKWDTKKIKVIQSASEDVPVTEELLYGDNFDGEEATQTYGNGSSWPYVDQFPEFANPTGPASQGVTYEGKGVSVRANSTSNSSYSDYVGSGSNNIFFGSNAYFLIKNISLDAAQKSYKMTFGSEKYLRDGDSMFSTNEFHVYISKNGAGWAELDYTYAGTEGGRWNVATVEFTLTEVPESLYVKFVADVASAYRLDDVKLFSGNGGQSVTLPETGGGDGGGTTPAPAEGIYASDVAFVCASDDSENAAYSLGATTINGNAVTGFKLGKSKQAGRFTSAAVGVSGEKYLNFYAQGWKGGDVTLYYRVDGGATMSQKLASHDGATGNPPYVSLAFAATDHYSVKLNLTETSTIEFSTDANFENTASESAMATARAIVCGVKLSDEPIEGEDGGNTTPEPTPGGVMTIAEAIAAAANTAVIVENATVIGVYGRGALIEDATGRILAYAGSAVDVVVGDIVKVEGTMTTYGGLPQIGGTVTFTKTGSKAYTYPTAKVMDGAAFDAYLGNPVIEYVEYTGTLTINGYYYNVEIEGASTAIGSLAYVIDGTVDPALNGQKIDVRGWTIGISSGKYVNTMIRSVVAAGTTPEPDPTPDPEPDPTPDGITAIADVLALGQGATINAVIEGVVISNYELNNLTSKKGMYVQDATGALQFYLAANHEFAFGTKVQIDLTGAKLGSYNGAVQVSGLALDKITVVSTGNTVTPKSISMADFLANKYEGQYVSLANVQVASSDLSNTWVVGGAHTSINMEDANGNKFVVFSSKYATYGAQAVAQGAGTINGISSINNGNIQIIFAQASDYAGLSGARFDGGETPAPDPTPDPDPTPGNSASISFADKANRTSYSETQQVWKQNGITVTNDKGASTSNVGDYADPARFYKSSNLTVAADKAFSQVIFYCDDYKATYSTDLQKSITSGSVTVDGAVVTLTLSAATTSYAITGLAGQVRMDSLTVVFAE